MANGMLVDQGVDLLKLICGLNQHSVDVRIPINSETLRLRCNTLLAEWTTNCQRAGADAAYIDAAKFSWVALIDERILQSEPALAKSWLEKPLQMQHFDSFSAGEEFYTRLESLRHPHTPKAADPLEVYHLCLCLGFTGKHGDDAGKERRRILVEQITGEILSARGAGNAELSPSGKKMNTAPYHVSPMKWNGLPVWLVPLTLSLLLLIVIVTVNGIIANRSANFVRSLIGHPR